MFLGRFMEWHLSRQKAVKCLPVFIFLALLFFTGEKACLSSGEKQTIVVFRFDDVSGRSSTVLEEKLIDAFRSRHLSCTFGVIPYVCDRDYLDAGNQGFIPLTPQKAAILKDAAKTETVEIALHGCTHQTIIRRETGKPSEFSGVEYNNQRSKIIKGKQLLEEKLGIRISTFVPPFNSYDLNTVKALEKQGVACLSANRFLDAKNPSSLKFLPITCELHQVRDAVASARNVPDEQPVIVVMFHEYDFIEIDKKRGRVSFQEFVRLLDWLAGDRNVKVMSIDKATRTISDLSPHRYIANRSYCSAFTLIPAFVGRPTGVYLTSSSAVEFMIRVWIKVIIFLAAISCVSGWLAFRIGKGSLLKAEGLRRGIIMAGSAFLLLAALYCLGLKEPGYRGSMLMAVLLGCCLGLCMAYVKTGTKPGMMGGRLQGRTVLASRGKHS